MSHLVALDQGTTSSRAIVFDRAGSVAGVAQRELEQHFPQPGWVEHDAEEIWRTQSEVAAQALARAELSAADIDAVGITNQRETTVVWDRATGIPIANAIVWQDRRTAPACERLVADGCDELVRAKTGLVLDAYFSATKIAWILDNVSGARERARAGELAFGTIDTWLAHKLSGGALHVTDASNASRTLLFDIRRGDWDDELLELFGVPRELLPEVRDSSEVLGEVAAPSALASIPIAGIVGDQQAALAGQLCFEPGLAKNTYGTGCFTLVNTGTEPRVSENRLLTTVAWRRDGELSYALEGSVFVGGAVVQWLRDGLGIITDSADVEELAASVPDAGGVVLVPAFTGLGAPYWDPHARGTIVGMTRGTTAAHIARAALEGIAHQVADLIDALGSDAGVEIPELRVDGGASANDTLMQLQADLLGIPVVRPQVTETTALGAAYLAGLAVGTWKGLGELAENRRVERRFEPALSRDKVESSREVWRRAVERARDWARAE